MRHLIFLSFSLLLLACNAKKDEKDEDTVARVNEHVLTKDEIKQVVPANTPKDDSIRLVKSYINNWVRTNLLVDKAEANLSDAQKDVEKQLADYRQSLIIYAYEKELIRQRLDTVVSEKEIEEYYNNNQKDFELKDNIVKVNYVKLEKKNTAAIGKIKKVFYSEKEEDRTKLEDACREMAVNYFLDDQSWLLFNDLLKEIPIKTYNEEQFLQNNRSVEMQDSAYLYLVNIRNFRIKDGVSPLSFERENIRNIILNKRKLNLINKMKDDLYKEALDKKQIEVLK
jgi:hypothetical protein